MLGLIFICVVMVVVMIIFCLMYVICKLQKDITNLKGLIDDKALTG